VSIVSGLDWPGEWTPSPFGRLVDRSKESGIPDLQPLSVFLDEGVVPRSSRDDNYNRLGADLSSYLVVRPGDIVFNKLRTWQGGIGVSAHAGIVSPAYFVARPGPTVFPRFIHYLLRSTPYLQELTRISKWMPPSQFDIAWEDLRGVPIWLPAIGRQRAIADYLDDETARIDAIISARRRQLALTREHANSAIAGLLRARSAPSVPMRRIVDLLAGFSYRSPDFRTDEGGNVRLLRGINVDVGRIRWDDCIWVDETIARETSRFELASGDVVIGMDRPVISTGVRVARVTADDVPAMLVQRVARLRARTDIAQDYLYLALRAPGLAAHFEPMFTGVSVPHVSPEQILAYEIPVPPRGRQEEVVLAAGMIMGQAVRYEVATQRQVTLLVERRQALITSTVTGQTDVPGVAA
jgi:type I restriction enzyme S subunit